MFVRKKYLYSIVSFSLESPNTVTNDIHVVKSQGHFQLSPFLAFIRILSPSMALSVFNHSFPLTLDFLPYCLVA